MPSSPLKIALIGAGPAALTLASILHHHNIPFSIYESSPSPRNQGGTLDLHPSGGQLALRAAGLWEEFTKLSRPESDVMKVVRRDGVVLWDGNGADAREVGEEEKFNGRPEIDRAVLMEMLLGAVPAELIHWGKKLAEVVPGVGETYDLHFADSSTERGFDLVVGADGAWSKVRTLLTPTQPHYSGISLIELSALDVAATNPWLVQYVGRGSCFSFGEGRTIQAQRIGDGSVRTYACLRVPESFIHDCGIDWSKPDSARQEYVERYFGDCGDDLKRLVLESRDQLIPRALYQLPVGFCWDSRPGVTLIGDAAHLMTPFAGVGVNAAMVDAMELGEGIAGFVEGGLEREGKSLATVIKDYETELFPRGGKFAQKTMVNMNKHFSATGSEDLVKRLRAAYGN
ncbi:monooxygenase [Lepidopterella palustris CBS 459.81]|uniref:Monooxygenase n=1 Tax=Lepidopterella palustris CBS 459.81 TaxID=1314670 RepID=A0A8E2JBR2_9PEZI|nr:monooxygenase [Lepidopterella palustris CBS 459.81]